MKVSNEFKIILFLSGLFLILWFIYYLRDILTPVFLAWFIAYLIDPVADKLERKMSRNLAVLIIVSGVILILAGVIFIFVPIISDEIVKLSKNFPQYVEFLKKSIFKHFATIKISEEFFNQLNQYIPKILKKIPSIISNFNHLFSTILNFLLIPVFTFYFLKDFDKIRLNIFHKIPPKIQPHIQRIATKIDTAVSLFIRGQLLICLILGFLYSIGLSIVKIDLAFLIGFLSGFLNLIPYFGFIIGIISSIIMAIIKFGDFWHVFGVIIVYGIVQILEGFVITPKILGNKIGLHPLNVIISLMIFGKIFGFIGLILAIPFASCIKVFYEELEEYYFGKNKT